MSIKRTKQRSFGPRGRDDDEPSSFRTTKAAEAPKTWAELMEGKADTDFLPYALTSRYPKGAFLLHSKFGKGIVTNVEGARIEVLFEDGPKKLGHAAS